MKKIVFVLVVSFIAAANCVAQHLSGHNTDAGRLAQQYFAEQEIGKNVPHVNEGFGTEATQQLRFFTGRSAGDYFGYSVAGAGDVNGDGAADVIIGAFGNDAAGTDAGKAYIFFGGASSDNLPDVTLSGMSAGENFGYSVAGAGDFNNDGFGDVLVGAPGRSVTGEAYLFLGGNPMNNTYDLVCAGSVNSQTGAALACAGDVNGDGYSDIVIGAPSLSGTGEAFIYYGGASVNEYVDVILTGFLAGNKFGCAVSGAGDYNGDGYDDVIAGAYNASGNGQSYIFYGGASMNSIVDITMTGQAAGDLFGAAVSGAGDVNGDGYGDVLIGAKNNDAAGSNAGRAYIFLGGAVPDASADIIFTGSVSLDYFGTSVAGAGDVNGDTYSDVIIGAPNFDGTGPDAGRALIYYGNAAMDNKPDIRLNGAAGSDYFGISAASAGDFNSDGYVDIIVGAHGNDGGGGDAGRAYVYANGIIGPDIPDEILTGASAGDQFGTAVANAGDVNGDGFTDIIVGAPYNDATSPNVGRAYVFYGGPSQDHTPDLILTGYFASDYFGCSVAGAGDVNGDGFSDVIVGSSGYGSQNLGAAYIYFGGISPDATADVLLWGESDYNQFGQCVAGAGDVNGDGYPDVIVGAPNYGTNLQGKAYIYFGGANMNDQPDVQLFDNIAGDKFGFSISGAGDVNNDGYSDVIIGSPYNQTGGSDAGKVSLYFGGAMMNSVADLTFFGTPFSGFGISVANAGDINKDGFSDIIIGSTLSATGMGKAYIYYGGTFMNTTPDITLHNESSGWLSSVAGIGDVNADEWDDVIVGAGNGDEYNALIYFGGASMDNAVDVVLKSVNTGESFGSAVAGAGDFDGNGLQDIIVGAALNDAGGTDAGRAYVYLSSAPTVKPVLRSVADVPNDQGGKVAIKFVRSSFDVSGVNRVSGYLLQRSMPPGTGGFAWENIASIPATREPYYLFTANTWSDSGTAFYRVSALGYNASELWRSNIMSGISVDNLAPTTVKNFAGAPAGMNNGLHWKANTETDLHSYAIYRAATNSIDPNTAAPIATLTDTILIDTGVPVGDSYYFIRAKDIHGNYGALTSLSAPLGMREVSVTALIEGFYDETANSMIQDTLTVELRNSSAPYTAIEQSKAYLNASGAGAVRMRAAENTGNYYVVVRHRNAIETWSKQPQTMADSRIQYDFTTAATTAYNDNLRQKGSKWCIFSGDVNQDGIVDYTDLSAIDNDSYNYTGGYVATDLTGDEFVDYTDLTIADNNNFNYVSVQSPLALLKKGATAQADNTGVPVEYEVSRNYPNPFNPSTRINYALPQDSRVVVTLFNMLGEKIATVIDKEEGAGYHTAMINMNNLPSGAYILHFTAGDYRKVQKIMLMK